MPMEENNVKFTKILSYFWIVVQRQLWLFLSIFFLYGVARVAANIILPLYYRRLVDVISGAIDRVAAAPEAFNILLMIAAIMLGYNLMYRIGDYCMTYFQSKVIRGLSDLSFEKLRRHSYAFFADTFAGSVVAKTRRFVRAFEVMHDQLMWSFWSAFIQLTGVFIVLFTIESALGIFFFVWTVVYILISIYFAKKKMPRDLLAASADSRVTARLSDAISNVLNLKIFSSGKREQAGFEEVTENQRALQLRAWNFGNLINAIQGLLMAILEVVSLYIAIRLWINGSISTGTVVLVQIYAGIIFATLWHLGKSMTRFAQSVSDASEMVDIFEQTPDVLDVENPIPFIVKEGTIEFKNVSFEYHEGVRVLRDFSLSIPAGEKVGLVGASGAGKSTITKLLLRFADVTSGEILVDGQNIAHAEQDDVRSVISFVPQDPILFHRSLEENIAYGRPNATKEEIEEAARNARAHDFISSFPEGYKTLVGERGVKLSGGERQRVAIARAMLENAPILVLDEATSSLDSISERSIQEAFEELLRDKTAIVIAHRLSTIRKMDRIIVMDKGEIIEDGSHAELISKEGAYYQLWRHQHDGFLADE